MSGYILRKMNLYRKGYELRGKLLAAYRTGGRPPERVLDGLNRISDELAALDTPEPSGVTPENWLVRGLREVQADCDANPVLAKRVAEHPSGFIPDKKNSAG